MSEINSRACELEPNVHVLLSSFLVQAKDGKTLNMCVFVEGGDQPKLHTFTKNTASNVDIYYKKKSKNFSQQKEHEEPTHHAEISASNDGFFVNMGSVFQVTVGDTFYTQAVDICLDHLGQHSKKILTRKIFEDASPNEIISERIEQCITSNSTGIKKESIITATVLHADPEHNNQCPFGKKFIPQNTLRQMENKNKYDYMQINESETGYKIENPPFGTHCTVEVFSERPVGKCLPQFKDAIKLHNDSVLYRIQMGTLNTKEKNIHAAKVRKNVILRRIEELEKNMLDICQISFWQEIFRTVEYAQKTEAQRIITLYLKLLKETLQDKNFEQEAPSLVKQYKTALVTELNIFAGQDTNNILVKSLKDAIKQTIDETLQNDLKHKFPMPSTTKHI